MSEQLVLLIVGACITLVSSVLLAVFNKVLGSKKQFVSTIEDLEVFRGQEQKIDPIRRDELKRRIDEKEKRFLVLIQNERKKELSLFVLKRFFVFYVLLTSAFTLGFSAAPYVFPGYAFVMTWAGLLCLGSAAFGYINRSVIVPITKTTIRENNVDLWSYDPISHSVTQNMNIPYMFKHRVTEIFRIVVTNAVLLLLLGLTVSFGVFAFQSFGLSVQFEGVSAVFVMLFYYGSALAMLCASSWHIMSTDMS